MIPTSGMCHFLHFSDIKSAIKAQGPGYPTFPRTGIPACSNLDVQKRSA